MVKRIVVGSDGSSRAGEAVRQAVELAKACDASLLVVRAYDEERPHDPATAYEPTLREDAATAQLPSDVARPVGRRAEVLASLEQDVAAAAQAGVRDVTPIARAGEPAESLIAVAEEHDADLIVIGNRGMTGASRFLLGSVPNKISHHAPCHVLIAHTS